MWEEQYKRTKRYLTRVKALKDVAGNSQSQAEEYDDHLWSFFVHCFHLKDWIKNDSAVPIHVRNAVEGCLNTSQALQISADLANRLKHYQLDKPRLDAKAAGKHHIATVSEGTSGTYASRSYDYIIDIPGGSKRKALDVMQEAIDDWGKFLKKYNLIA